MSLIYSTIEDMIKPIVEVKHLSKSFGSPSGGFKAVNDISFSIQKGEIVGLLGPNGAGKTTTIHMLLGLITPTSGTIEIFGKDMVTHRELILSRMNFSSTYTHLPWRLSVFENLYTVALLYTVPHAKKRVHEVMRLLHLDTVQNTTVDQLSSGWVTRVNLARTFLNRPKLILLDEPTASLDPEIAAEVRELFISMKDTFDTTLLWTSHNMAEVEEVCDRVIFLHRGKIIAQDTPSGLARTIKICHVHLYIEDDPKKVNQFIKSSQWKIKKEDRFMTIQLPEKDISKLLMLLAEKKISYTQISIDKPTLEDYFLSMTKRKGVRT